MVAGAIELDAGLDKPAQRVRKGSAGRVEDGEVVEPGGARGRRRAALALPGIEPDMVMIVAGGAEGRARPIALRQFEAEHVAVEGNRPVDIRDLEVDMADPRPGIDGGGE